MAIREGEARKWSVGVVEEAGGKAAGGGARRGPRAGIDWSGIEQVFCTGGASVRAIGRMFGVTEGAIRYRARQCGWVREPMAATAGVQADDWQAADCAADVEGVRRERYEDAGRASMEGLYPVAPAPGGRVVLSPPEVVEGQRGDIAHAREVVRRLFGALACLVEYEADLVTLGGVLAEPDAKGVDRLNEVYQKVIALPSQVEMAKRLADTLRLLVELERKVLCIGEGSVSDGVLRATGDAVAMDAMEAYARMCEGRDD